MKKVLIISTTLRRGGNSEILAEEFARGASEAGNQTEILSLREKTIHFCRGCMSCASTKNCVIRDDANEIMLKMRECDVVIFATPIYYYEMTGQMKTLIDRCNPNFNANFHFKKVYLIATAADNSISAMDGAVKGIQGFVDCYSGSELSGVVYGIGLTNLGDASRNHKIMKEAYTMGRNV